MMDRLRTDMAMGSLEQLVPARFAVVNHLERERTVTNGLYRVRNRKQHRKLDFCVFAPTNDCLR